MAVLARFCCLCGRGEDEVGPLSARGKCGQCGPKVVEMNILQMRARRGPFFEHWQRRLAAGVLGVPLDDVDETG